MKTVNLSKIAEDFGGKTSPSSRYKLLQRFFRSFEFDNNAVTQTVMRWMDIPQPLVLSVD